MVETYRGTVYPWQCDHMNHMNLQFYAARFDEATWQLFNKIGLTPEYLKAQDRGMAAVDQRIQYKRELYPGDCITVESRIIETGRKSIRFQHVMKKSGTDVIAAVTELVGLHIDSVQRRSCDFSKEIYQTINQYHEDAV